MPQAGSQFGNIVAKHAAIYPKGRQVTSLDGTCEFWIDRDVTAAEMQTGSVTLLSDSEVPRGMKCYVTDYVLRWGGTAFGGATSINLSDNNTAAPVDFVSVAAANTANAFHVLSSSAVTQTGVTQASALTARTGGTTNSGLRLRGVGGTPTGGSAFSVFVRGFYAP